MDFHSEVEWVFVFTSDVELVAAFDVATDNGQSSLVDFSGSGYFTGRRRRESIETDQLAVSQPR